MSELAWLILPAVRWRSSTGYEYENGKIEESLRLGVGGFIIFGGAVGEARILISELQTQSRHPLLIGSDFERGGGQQLEGLTHLPAPAALGFIDEPEITRRWRGHIGSGCFECGDHLALCTSGRSGH